MCEKEADWPVRRNGTFLQCAEVNSLPFPTFHDSVTPFAMTVGWLLGNSQ